MARLLALALLAAGTWNLQAFDLYGTAQQKFDRIASDRLAPGARIPLTAAELSAYAAHQAPTGVRDPQVKLVAADVVTGTAFIDFGKVRRAQGYEPGWLLSKLLDGERPVSVTVRIHSSKGTATVDVERVEISGLVIDGKTLDFVIRNFLLAMYPDAMVGRPFELVHHIERIEVAPAGVGIVIGR